MQLGAGAHSRNAKSACISVSPPSLVARSSHADSGSGGGGCGAAKRWCDSRPRGGSLPAATSASVRSTSSSVTSPPPAWRARTARELEGSLAHPNASDKAERMQCVRGVRTRSRIAYSRCSSVPTSMRSVEQSTRSDTRSSKPRGKAARTADCSDVSLRNGRRRRTCGENACQRAQALCAFARTLPPAHRGRLSAKRASSICAARQRAAHRQWQCACASAPTSSKIAMLCVRPSAAPHRCAALRAHAAWRAPGAAPPSCARRERSLCSPSGTSRGGRRVASTDVSPRVPHVLHRATARATV